MIKIIESDIFASEATVIAHQVNCRGVMGAGLAKQVKERYPSVAEAYASVCNTYRNCPERLLGYCQAVGVIDENYKPFRQLFLNNPCNRIIVNCFAQLNHGFDKKQTDLRAFRECVKYLQKLRNTDENGKTVSLTIAIPYKMGCGLAGADWDTEVYPLISKYFGNSENTLLICREEKII